jgi:beta-N-acetylhexosaminidase
MRKEQIASVEAALGQLLMVGISGPELRSEEKALLTEHRIGGVILFRRNVVDPIQVSTLCADLHRLGGDRILIAIDQEGGRVSRLPPPFTQFPAVSALAQHESDRAYRIGTAMAKEMRAVGIDLDFAPVLDVASNPRNPVIEERAFSSDPWIVTRLGCAMIRGLMDGGVIPCGKHFPGHGDTEEDSHFTLPVVLADEVTMREREQIPFRHAIAEGLPSLMTAHVLYPHLDREYPATLSLKILTNLLREELGFSGLLFSDDLAMEAISQLSDAAALAVKAGVDVLLLNEDLNGAAQTLELLKGAVEDDPVLKHRVLESCNRVRELKKRMNRSIFGALPFEIIGCKEHQLLIQSCFR